MKLCQLVRAGFCLAVFSVTLSAKPVVEMQTVGDKVAEMQNDAQYHGGLICASTDQGYYLGWNQMPLSSNQIKVSKMNHEGVSLWTKSFSFTGSPKLHSICSTSDNGCLAIASCFSAGNPMHTVYICKFDSLGNFAFSTSARLADSFEIASVTQLRDSGFAVTGTVVTPTQKVLLAKISKSGSILWTRTYGNDSDRGKAVRGLPDGSIIIAGETGSIHSGKTEVFLLKTDFQGNATGYRTYGGATYQNAYALDLTSDKGFVIAGETNSYSNDKSYEAFILKVDSLFNYQWYKTFGGYSFAQPGQRCAYGVAQTDDKGYALCFSDISNGSDSLTAIQKLDSSGNMQWLKRFSGTLLQGNSHLIKEPFSHYTISYTTTDGHVAITRVWDDDSPVKIAVFSDPHYFAPSLLIKDGPAFQGYIAQDRKLIAESHAIARATVSKIRAAHPDICLVTGDCTKDGELVSHQEFSKYLVDSLISAGIRVYVIPGNHDINNPEAYSYNDAAVTPVANVSPADFAAIYGKCGFGQAIAHDDSSLTYITQPTPGLWIIAIDACKYKNNVGHSETGGALSPHTLSWLLTKLDYATANNITVLGMMHQGLTEHFNGQTTILNGLFKDYVVDDWTWLRDTLANHGLKTVFTGHYHANDIVERVTATGSNVLDIETGSTVTWPCPVRNISLTFPGTLDIKTTRIDSIDYNTNGLPFQTYAEQFLRNGMLNLVTYMFIYQFGIPAAQAQALAPAVTNALVAHYAGDETPTPVDLYTVNMLKSSTDPLTQSMGLALEAIWTDPAPHDNNVTLVNGFETGSVTDTDGNIYHTIQIGNQVWTVENLKTTKYNDGTAIPLVTDGSVWSGLTTPGYCWYNNDIANKSTYGALYNWYAVNTGKLAPAGWHVATSSDWTTLQTYVGWVINAGGKLKETGTFHWLSPNISATNSVGFSALPGGYRRNNGIFYNQGTNGSWWSSSGFAGPYASYDYITNKYASIVVDLLIESYGCSIRLVKNSN